MSTGPVRDGRRLVTAAISATLLLACATVAIEESHAPPKSSSRAVVENGPPVPVPVPTSLVPTPGHINGVPGCC